MFGTPSVAGFRSCLSAPVESPGAQMTSRSVAILCRDGPATQKWLSGTPFERGCIATPALEETMLGRLTGG